MSAQQPSTRCGESSSSRPSSRSTTGSPRQGPADRKPDAAGAWAATDELRLSGWSFEAAEETLGRTARELSRRARETEKDLWYWWSL
jgi:hypothetical protein